MHFAIAKCENLIAICLKALSLFLSLSLNFSKKNFLDQ